MSLSGNYIADNGLFLQVSCELFTVRLGGTIEHHPLGRASPSDPCSVQGMDKGFCRTLLIWDGSVKIGG